MSTDSPGNEPTPAAGTPQGWLIEPWLTRSVGHSWLVAFHSGRLFNAMRFHVYQAFILLIDRSTRAESERQFQLTLSCLDFWRGIMDRAASRRVAMVQRLDAERESICHYLGNALDEDHVANYRYQVPDVTYKTIVEAYLRLPKYNVLNSLRAMSETLDRLFSRRQREFFRLGVQLDEGLRPSDVYWRMLGPASPRQPSWPAFGPAELTRDTHWTVQLQLWSTTAIPELSDNQEIRAAFERLKTGSDEISSFVDTFDRELRQSVIDLPDYVFKDLPEVSLNPLQITFQGRTYPLSDNGFQAALFFQMVVEAGGEFIAIAKMKEKNPNFLGVTPSRLRAALPAPPRHLMQSEPRLGTRLQIESLS